MMFLTYPARGIVSALCFIASLSVIAGCAPRASYVCDNGKTLEVTFHDHQHKITVDTGQGIFDLRSVPASTGARYSDEDRTFWFKGDELSIDVDGRAVFGQCRKIAGTSDRP